MKYGEMNCNQFVMRRRDKRVWFVILMLFVGVSLFTFLTQKFKDDGEVTAASLAGFDPGYIISDWQMGNYNSMSEGDIQAFLTAKNSCANRNYNYYLQLSGNKSYTWHWKDGHFVCLSEELFGDGEVIGSGETAAHIIWRAAQDYKINPQVLLVLLQKETSLITDPIPNNGDYRKATGYGCPDTAPCSSQYYGFKNQVRKAAALFSTVLNGGWTNYPLGNNYIQYNPNASCGGSVVNIRSLATSALYRYTPYQPNAGAIAAGYGTASCGAYGNRNFYLYFQDWFGGITDDGYIEMEVPRYMTNVETGEMRFYRWKRNTGGGICLSEEKDSACVDYKKLTSVKWEMETMVTPRYLIGDSRTEVVSLNEKSNKTNMSGETVYFDRKVLLPDGKQCLIPEDSEYGNWCAVWGTLSEAKFEEQAMIYPRVMKASRDSYFINPNTRARLSKVKKNSEFILTKKLTLPDGNVCLISEGVDGCILQRALSETWNKMEAVRDMVVKNDTYKVNINTGERNKSIRMNVGMKRKFVSKIYYDGDWCLRTEYDEELDSNECVALSKLGNTWNKLDEKERRIIKKNAEKIDVLTFTKGMKMLNEESRLFTHKYFIGGGNWCYRTEYDTGLNTNYCFLESDLE